MSIDDSNAKKDWNWKPNYDIKKMTEIMLEKLELKYNTKLITK